MDLSNKKFLATLTTPLHYNVISELHRHTVHTHVHLYHTRTLQCSQRTAEQRKERSREKGVKKMRIVSDRVPADLSHQLNASPHLFGLWCTLTHTPFMHQHKYAHTQTCTLSVEVELRSRWGSVRSVHTSDSISSLFAHTRSLINGFTLTTSGRHFPSFLIIKDVAHI